MNLFCDADEVRCPSLLYLNSYLLSTYHVPGTVPGINYNKTKGPNTVWHPGNQGKKEYQREQSKQVHQMLRVVSHGA